MTSERPVPHRCRLCRAIHQFETRREERAGEAERVLAESGWFVAALERGRPCRTHERTLARAHEVVRRLVELRAHESEAVR
jgi:hypothetical protein